MIFQQTTIRTSGNINLFVAPAVSRLKGFPETKHAECAETLVRAVELTRISARWEQAILAVLGALTAAAVVIAFSA